MDSYTVRPTESISLKCLSIQTVHSMQFKFSICIISACPTYCIDFGEFRINSFLQEYKKESYALKPMESNC